jgi:hypothetical protein
MLDPGQAEVMQGLFHVGISDTTIGGQIDTILTVTAKACADLAWQLSDQNSMEAEVHSSVTECGDAHGVFTTRSGQPGKLFALRQVNGHPSAAGRYVLDERDEEYEKDEQQRGDVDLADILQATLADSFVVASARRPNLRCIVTTEGVDASRQSGE